MLVSINILFDVLLKTNILMSPHVPFLTEHMYQNLRKCCVLNSFAKHFTNLKIIGKGSFAKVLLSKRNQDQKEFAVKTFDKKQVAAKSKVNFFEFF